ncbi:MAG: DNA helicase RecQ [Alphaproteobacteria bacterium]|nr:DNA helicase RecQ [Rickettsiales bacterium]
MTQNPKDILKSTFGFYSFKGKQEEIINHILLGHNALVLMPTGGGKSLCYQIPALCMDGLCIVVSPLIALMQDQITALKECGVKAESLNSSLNYKSILKTQSKIKSGELKLLYVAPEKLMTESFLNFLSDVKISMFAIDEAHCISSWGHDFRPEYLALSKLVKLFPSVQRLALTATADIPTRNEIITKLGLQNSRIFLSSFDRANIKYHISPKDNPSKQLKDFLSKHQGESGIIYCLSRNKTEKTAEALKEQGLKALPYHAGLDKSVRTKNQDTFIKEDAVIIVATIAFGMGIDKPDVRFVVHLDMSKTIESYYQETGRAGRDGLESETLMLYGMRDMAILWSMVVNSEALEQHKKLESKKVSALLGLCETVDCRRKVMLEYFGEEVQENKKKCGNCDTCLNPIINFDGTTVTQKAISAVYRTGQIFGAEHVISNLLGKQTPKMTQFNHHKVSTFGIGKEDLTIKQWRSVFRQLVAMKILTVDMEKYGSVKLSNNYKQYLKQKIYLRYDADHKKINKVAGNSATKCTKGNYVEKIAKEKAKMQTAEETQLLTKLKEKRLELAKKHNIPPYIIFHNAALIHMVKDKPKTLEEMSQISGVGNAKLKKYGEIFLETLLSFK